MDADPEILFAAAANRQRVEVPGLPIGIVVGAGTENSGAEIGVEIGNSVEIEGC